MTRLSLHNLVECPHCGVETAPDTIGKDKEVAYMSRCTTCKSIWVTYVKWFDGKIIFAVPPMYEGTPYNKEMDDTLTMREPKFFIQPDNSLS